MPEHAFWWGSLLVAVGLFLESENRGNTKTEETDTDDEILGLQNSCFYYSYKHV